MAEIEGYTRVMNEQFDELLKAVDGLSADALNWRPPAPQTNSIFVLATHIAGTAAFWVQQLIGGVDIGRSRDAEFVASGPDLAEWGQRLADMRAKNDTVLRGLSDADLSRSIKTFAGERPMRWGILHIIDHTSRHIGHIELTRQLWEQRNG
jgi:uncharacterized damage-inducible protein DinB